MGRPFWVAVVSVVAIALASYGVTQWQTSSARAIGKARVDSAEAANAPMQAEQSRRDTLTTLLDTLLAHAHDRPNDSMLVISTANIAYNLERFDIAEKFYRRFLDSIDPKHVDVTIDYAYSMFMNGQPALAVTTLEQVVRREPGNQAALYNLGILHLRTNAPEKGLLWMRRCRDANPTSDVGQRAANLITTLERTS